MVLNPPFFFLQEGPVDKDCKVNEEPKSAVQVASSSSCSDAPVEKKTGRRNTRFDMRPLTSIEHLGEVNNKEQLIPKNSKIEGPSEVMEERGAVRFSSNKEFNNWPLTESDQVLILQRQNQKPLLLAQI